MGGYMNKKSIIGAILFLIVLFVGVLSLFLRSKDYEKDKNTLEATVLYTTDSTITVQDSHQGIYTMEVADINAEAGDTVVISYTGLLDKNSEKQEVSVIDYEVIPVAYDMVNIPTDWLDNGIFSEYYTLAFNKLKTLTLDEVIGQILLVRYPDVGAVEDLKKYKFSGFVFFEKDFRGKTKTEVQDMIKNLQSNSKIPLLTAVDEEGGKVVRVSSNSNLADSKFKSSQDLYTEGGFSLIKNDTINKSKILSNLGLNLNLAPVVDVSTNPSDYMYERSFGKDTNLTSTYAKTVIEASKGTGVSYTLKHFPGYGNNSDTHTGSVIDTRSYDDIVKNDLPPFKAGIEAGAEAVLVSHNTVNNIDPSMPASLSASVHNILRNQLDFTGIIMTDDLSMGATSSIDNAAVKAILAGNDLIITTDYEADVVAIKEALETGVLCEPMIDKLAFRVLTWKYYKGMMFESK